MFAVPSALTASWMVLRPNPCTMFGGARSTNWRSTSAMVCSSRLKASIRPASRSLNFAMD